jgi:glycolate oxidase FAD binding subunit
MALLAESLRIDNLECSGLYQPQTVDELRQMVRHAAAENQAIYPIGGRTMLDFGLPPTKRGIAVDLTKLNEVIDYPARDMTITVQAGITIARLQDILATEGQRLPIDVPLPERATLGGAIACNVSGPRRYGFGTLRDYVIGITVVNDEADETKAGGRVVKNVAGYDLCKLYTGSLGTLGIITEVTLKVRPAPEALAMLSASCAGEALGEALDRLHQSTTRPACIDIARESSENAFQLYVGFEDNRRAVDWQVQRLREELGARWSPQECRDAAADQQFVRLGQAAYPATGRLCFRANVLPREAAGFCLAANAATIGLRAHAGTGIVIGRLSETVTLEDARSSIQQLREKAVEAHGNLILLRCPIEWKKDLGVWGDPRGDWALMGEIKKRLDPKNLFNPGRFVDGA